MTKITLTLAAVAASLTLSSLPAAAGPCAAREAVANELAVKFKETRQGIGLTGQSTVIELYVSNEGGWTLVATDTAGRSCIIGTGQAWEDEPKVLAGLTS